MHTPRCRNDTEMTRLDKANRSESTKRQTITENSNAPERAKAYAFCVWINGHNQANAIKSSEKANRRKIGVRIMTLLPTLVG